MEAPRAPQQTTTTRPQARPGSAAIGGGVGAVAGAAPDAEAKADRGTLVAASVDGTIRSFDIRRGTCAVDDVGTPVTCVSLSNDGYLMLASCVVRCR
ncbi:MAG: hypothetical protein VXY90_14110, partial [Pseudomonadota bacterium]|nr:hypothetical protein [Pseudomonadota bacterium]MEC8585896.1 hypothetical protein [Pseudomonadota bacterium]